MKKTEIPRGIRNNNPLNIRRSKADWQGLSKEVTDKEFCQFENMFYGFHAAFKLLFNYYYKHGLRTVKGIINRWAPSSDGNDCNVYAKFVINYMMGNRAFEANTQFIMPKPEDGPHSWKLLVKAMAEMESTKAIRQYFEGNINEAYEAAIKSLKPQT